MSVRTPSAGQPSIPYKMQSLHRGEEFLRQKAEALVDANADMKLQLRVVEGAMDLADRLRQFETPDEDLKVAQLFGMRIFNAFASSLKLVMAGYAQNGALILRDVIETVFLLDLFQGDPSLIAKWRLAGKKTLQKTFSPIQVRMTLDARDGTTSMKRAEMYEMFSKLAGHPTMQSAFMLRPRKDGDAFIGPFIEETTLTAVLSEMGKLAVQAGEKLDRFFPKDWDAALDDRVSFAKLKLEWLDRYYPHRSTPVANP